MKSAGSGSLPQTTTFTIVDDQVQALVDEIVGAGRSIKVLEAGCGSRSHIRLAKNAHLVGIDISAEQLERNEELNERMLGDIQTFPLEPCSYDIIFCWDVLEHLEHPELAIQNFVQAVREGGIIVLGAPIVNSLKGTVAKFTPLWFHVWVFRHLMHNQFAGKPGHGPFKTFLKPSMSPRAIEHSALEARMAVEQFTVYKDQMEAKLRARHWILDLGFDICKPLVRILSFGSIDPEVTDFVVVLRKPGNAVAAAAPKAVERMA